tara:strand:- start:830 stop:1558 length:729 start_codon:yes stop_codon:yes gene_type:complete
MNSDNFLIYGKRAVYEALENDVEIGKVFLQKNNSYLDNIKSKIQKKNIQVSFVPVEKLNRLTKNNHQGIVATISPISTLDFNDLENKLKTTKSLLILVLDGITDTKNFGAIIRSAECFDVDLIIIPKTGSSTINGETIKSSSGAIFNIPICKVNHVKDAIFLLKENEINLVGTSDKGSESLYKHTFNSRTALIVGSEGKGVNKSVLKLCDQVVSIVMHGRVSSLNVSVATGIFLSEFRRQLN